MKKILSILLGCMLFVSVASAKEVCTISDVIVFEETTQVIMTCEKDTKLTIGDDVKVKVKKVETAIEGC